MKAMKRVIALLAVVSVPAVWTVVQAATPGQADFDTCNREAQARAGSPAASPGGTGSTDTSGSRAGGGPSSPSTPSGGSVPGSPSGGASGSGGSAGSGGPSGSAGTSGGSTGGGMSGSGGAGTSGSTGSIATAPGSSDIQTMGMASIGQSDSAYQQAYRDCMRRRGF